MNTPKIFVVGAGTMGQGIAQLAAQKGHDVCLYDLHSIALEKAKSQIKKSLEKLVEKGKLTQEKQVEILGKLKFVNELHEVAHSDLVIEAIVEDVAIKHKVFIALEALASEDCILATNTSSLSIASIAVALKVPSRFLGIHFFNPATLMPLVEIIPSVLTDPKITVKAKAYIDGLGKDTVVCKDTPGFIVNRVARPFYGEALRMYEEGMADFATIDWAMKTFGGFKMGPFELMDYIGNDVNYTVTETVFEAFYFDPRFKPSFTQKRLKEAGLWGKKTGRGFYSYDPNEEKPKPNTDEKLGMEIFNRILSMLVNEAYDAVFMQVASPKDIDLAMVKGVNYPKGLLEWSVAMGPEKILATLETLFLEYGEDRYRPNPLLRKCVREGLILG
ncbi:MAG: 3-hydroxybutyryl-CoA dehydrogenase [Flavobacteriia bacterium]|nr:3-hydroxybutyryl-CoA dehydrogenase [Flavobacteriia bacterium]